MPSTLNIVILTGAGISAESGLPTFRDANGLWEGHRVEEVATPEAFIDNPTLVHRFYNMRREALLKVQPNAAHISLAKLQKEHAGKVTIITQNVDDLHERGGSTDVIHMHGKLRWAKCTLCAADYPWDVEMSELTVCPHCGQSGGMRPDIVWFGEMPYHMDEIGDILEQADLFVAIGTSGNVYPAAGFVLLAKRANAITIEINNANTNISTNFDRRYTGPATEQVPLLVDWMLAQGD